MIVMMGKEKSSRYSQSRFSNYWLASTGEQRCTAIGYDFGWKIDNIFACTVGTSYGPYEFEGARNSEFDFNFDPTSQCSEATFDAMTIEIGCGPTTNLATVTWNNIPTGYDCVIDVKGSNGGVVTVYDLDSSGSDLVGAGAYNGNGDPPGTSFFSFA